MSELPPPRPRSHYRAWRSIATRWMDNDAYGHVNNTVYYSWFDTAVNGWLLEAGLLDVKEGRQIGLVVATSCRYFRSVAFPETVEAGLAVRRIGRSSVTYEIGLFTRGLAEPAAEGDFVHVYVDRDDRRPRAVDERWRAALGSLAPRSVR